MAIAKLEYVFGADLDPLKLSLNEVNKLITQTGKDAAKAGADGIGKFNVELIRLKDYADKLKNIGLPDSIPDTAKRSRIALTDLSRVVQDLPFGFIGIQNNIPALVQSFGSLRKEGGGLVGGLKLLGQSLIGPSGVFFAFSAVTSLITIGIKEYGSFGNLIEALIGTQSKFNKELQNATKSYKEYNDSKRTNLQITSEELGTVAANIQSINTLINIIGDQTQSYENRNTALNNLKSINKDYFGNLDLEKTKYSDLKLAVESYIKSIKQSAITKGFEESITNSTVELAKQQNVLNTLKKERDDIARKPVRFIGKADQVDTRELDRASARFSEQNKIVNDLKETIKSFSIELDKSVRKEVEIKAPIDAANEAFKKSEELEKDRIKNLQKRLKLNKENADKSLQIELDKNKREENAFKVLRDAYVTILSDSNKELYKLQEDYEEKRSTLIRANNFDFTSIDLELRLKQKEIADKYNEIALRDEEKAAKERLRIQEEIGKSARNQFESTFIKGKGKEISEEEKNAKALEQSYLNIGKTIFSNVINPLNQLFDIVLSKGEKSWEDFTASVVESLKKLVAKLAAAAAIAGILSLATGGTAGGGVSFIKAFGSIFGGGLGGGGVANPSFGGVQPGGMQMAGSVNMVLRGQDLVGSLNRTNSQFSRVG